jgi:hypothetical protein
LRQQFAGDPLDAAGRLFMGFALPAHFFQALDCGRAGQGLFLERRS